MDDVVVQHARGLLLRQQQIDALVADGIPPLNLTKTEAGLWFMVRHDRVVFTGDTFAFARDARGQEGQGAFTFLCFDNDGEPFDICAWRPPAVATWLGKPYALGQENAYRPRLEHALPVHSSVSAWFKHNRNGLYILRASEAAIALRNEVLGVDTEHEARALRQRLTLESPPVVVARAEIAA